MITAAPPTIPTKRFIPLSEWDQHYAWPTVGALRWMVYNAASNGMERFNVTRRVGKRILLDPDAFHAWVDSNPATTGATA